MRYHLDTDFLVYALSSPGPERRRLRALAASDAEIQMSAVAWYEFSRGPRTPDQLAGAPPTAGGALARGVRNEYQRSRAPVMLKVQ